nr:LacI family DNA-binding transcriptional regulator [uncultured Agathobaculum sp.]
MSKRATIQDVAERAGVSRGTVDRVINNRSYVSAEVRARILQAIEEIGYIPPRQVQIDKQPESFPPLRLGVVLPNWTGGFKNEVSEGIAKARCELAPYHVEIRVCVCETDLPVECIEHLDALANWGAQGIALCALNDIVIETKVGELTDRGIPCITFNSDLPSSKRLCFVGQDYAKSGRIAAELLSKCVPCNAHILAMVGNLEYHGHRTRLDGFCARMHELGFSAAQIEITETYNNYRLTCDKVRQALHDMPDLVAIYMVNRSVTGCTDALRQAGAIGRIHVVAHDVSARTKLLLQEGSLDFTITQDMVRQGYLPLILLRELLQKGTQPQEDQLSTRISIICSQNIE